MGIFNQQAQNNPFSRGIQGAPGVGFRLTPAGDFDITGKKLTNVGAPTANADAATKKYVDDSSTSHTSSGLTVNSNIDMKDRYRILNLKSPSDADEPATKQYADSTFLDRGGDRGMIANLDMNNNKIIELKNPTTGTDAANKQYVDSQARTTLTTATASRNLDMQNRYRITNLQTPVDPHEPPTKSYVDNTFLERDGSYAMTGNLQMGNHKITGVRVPTSSSDAATKKYVDDHISSSSPDLSDYLEKDGTVAMTGNLNMGTKKIVNLAAPTANTDAATKKYVDDKPSGSGDFKKDGSVTMTGNLNMGTKKIVNLAAPTTSTDASTKKYVDDEITYSGDFKKDGSRSMTGNMNMGGFKISNMATPTNNNDAATKKYVDDNSSSGGGGGDFKKDGSVAMTGNLNMNSKRIINLPIPVDSTDAASVSWVKNQIQHFNLLSSPVFTVTAAPAYTTIYFQHQNNKFVATTSRPGQSLVSWKPVSGTYINKIVFNFNRQINLRKVSFVARDSNIGNVDFWISGSHTGLYTFDIHRTFTYELSGVFLEYVSDANSGHPPITTNVYTGKPSAETKVFSKIKFSSPTEFTDTVTASTPTTNTQVATKEYVDRSVAGPAHYKNVFDFIMQSASQWTDEITTRTSFVIKRFGDLATNSGNFHSYNHRVIYFGLKKYSAGYKFKFGLNFYRLAASDYTICLEFLNSDYRLWHKTQIAVDHQSSSGLTFHSESVKKLTHTYYYPAGTINYMYYHRVIVSFTKNSSGRSFFHVTVNMPDVGGDMISYPSEFTKFYVVVYGINGAVGNIDPDKSYDYHTAFDTQSSQVVYNVPINMNNKAITNLRADTNSSSAATFGSVSELRDLSKIYFYRSMFDEIWDFTLADKYDFTATGSSSSIRFGFNALRGLIDNTKKITFANKTLNNVKNGGIDINNYYIDIPLNQNQGDLVLIIVFYFWANNNFTITRFDNNANRKLFEIQYDKIARRVSFESGGRRNAHNMPNVNDTKVVFFIDHRATNVLNVRISDSTVYSLTGFGSVRASSQKVRFYSQGGFMNKVMINGDSRTKSDKIIMQEILL